MEPTLNSLSYNSTLATPIIATATNSSSDEAEALISRKSTKGSEGKDSEDDTGKPVRPVGPREWKLWYRRYITALVCVILFLVVLLTSEGLSVFARELSEEYNVKGAVVSIVLSSFSLSFCLGPLLWSPLSERYGRRPILLVSFNLFTFLQVCTAVSQNVASIVIVRFLAGFFGSACLALAPAVIADIWDTEDREKEIGNYVLNSMSPSAGAILGLTLANNGVDWRSTCWVLSIIVGLCTALVVTTFRETHFKPVIRPVEAATTNDDCHDNGSTHLLSSSDARFTANNKPAWMIAKPYVLLGRSPVLIVSSIYLAFIGTLVSIFFKVAAVGLLGYPPIIQMCVSSAVLLGCTIGLILHNVLIYPRYYIPRIHRYGTDLAPPELRLSLAICAAPLLPFSLVLFGWTLSPHISVVLPLLACLTLGLSAQWIMQTMVNYVIDIYPDAVASAVSWHTVLTYTFVTAFSVYSEQILRAGSTRVLSTIMGCVAIALVPVPILLARYGHTLRAKSRRPL